MCKHPVPKVCTMSVTPSITLTQHSNGSILLPVHILLFHGDPKWTSPGLVSMLLVYTQEYLSATSAHYMHVDPGSANWLGPSLQQLFLSPLQRKVWTHPSLEMGLSLSLQLSLGCLQRSLEKAEKEAPPNILQYYLKSGSCSRTPKLPLSLLWVRWQVHKHARQNASLGGGHTTLICEWTLFPTGLHNFAVIFYVTETAFQQYK